MSISHEREELTPKEIERVGSICKQDIRIQVWGVAALALFMTAIAVWSIIISIMHPEQAIPRSLIVIALLVVSGAYETLRMQKLIQKLAANHPQRFQIENVDLAHRKRQRLCLCAAAIVVIVVLRNLLY